MLCKKIFNENYKILAKETEEDTNKWKDGLYSLKNIVKMLILFKARYRSSAITIDIPMVFIAAIEKSMLKFI